MKLKFNLGIFSILIAISFVLNGTIVNDENFEQRLAKGIEITGGSSILLEEYTATWCQICADIDNDVKELTKLHDDRVILLRIHPADGVDNLGNYASATRISLLFNESSKGTPTFIIDGNIAFEGLTTISQLNSMILQTQSKKFNFSEMYMSVIRVNETLKFEIEIYNNSKGIINIMIFENKVTSNNPNGNLEKFDNVLREMISVNISDEKLISGESEWGFEINKTGEKIKILATYNINGNINLKNLGFVSTHEINDENGISVKGSVQIISEENSDDTKSYHLLIFSIFLGIGIFASLGKFNNRKNKIQENE
jgi:hypothetical protein